MDNRCTRFWAVLGASFAMLAAVAFFVEGGRMNTRRDFVRGLTGIGAIVATGNAPAIVRSMIAARGTMFGGESPNSYKLLDKTLEYFKFILGIDKIDFRQTDTIDGELNSNVKIDGDLYFGTMNMGKISVSLEMIDGIWYISKVDTSALKLDSVLKQSPDAKKLLGES